MKASSVDFEMGGIIPVEVSSDPGDQKRHKADGRQDGMAAEEPLSRRLLGLFILRRRRLSRLGRLGPAPLGGLAGALAARALARPGR